MERNYYSINYETSDEITGKDYPQADCLNIDEIGKFSSWELNKNEKILKFKLNNKSKLTDVISVLEINTGFLISPKVKAIFDDFNLMRHQYFEASVETKSGVSKYYWLHLSEPNLSKLIDYKKSTFYETEFTFKKEQINIDSFEHYQKLKSKDKEASFGVKLEQICFSNKFDNTLDLFAFLPFNNEVFISEKLKKELVKNEIFSFKISDADVFI